MRFVTVTVATLLLAGCQTTQFSTNKSTLAGRIQQVDRFGSLNPDCSPIGEAVIRVTRQPANGRVLVEKGRDFLFFGNNNVRSRCNATRVPATTVSYAPNSGFIGTDSFDVEVIFGSGGTRTKTYNMTVR